MNTIIHYNRRLNQESDSSTSLIIGVMLMLVIFGLFFIYGLPQLRSNNGFTPESEAFNMDTYAINEETGPTPSSTPGSLAY
jgi:hypothetical protein